jgi:hypothetical protein
MSLSFHFRRDADADPDDQFAFAAAAASVVFASVVAMRRARGLGEVVALVL